MVYVAVWAWVFSFDAQRYEIIHIERTESGDFFWTTFVITGNCKSSYNFDVEVVAAFFRYSLYRNEMYILLVKTMYRWFFSEVYADQCKWSIILDYNTYWVFTITLSVLDIRKHVERIMVVQVRQEPHEVRWQGTEGWRSNTDSTDLTDGRIAGDSRDGWSQSSKW